MGHIGKGYDVNQTFIIESVGDESPIISACTALYANFITSCSGNTSILLGEGVINFDGSIYTNDVLSASTIHASTYYSGGTNMYDIINNFSLSGGSFDDINDSLTLYRQDGNEIIITGFTNYYTTGTTLVGNTVYFNRNDQLSAYTVNLDVFSADTYVTGATFSNNQLILMRNDGQSFSVFLNNFSGLTVNGGLLSNNISATTISATTYYGDGSNLSGISTQDIYVTGFTYSNNNLTISRNYGQLPLTVNISTMTGLTINGSTQLNGSISSSNLSGSTTRLVEVNSGGTFSANKTFIEAYISSASTAAILLSNDSNWDIGGVYTGSTISGTFMGQKYYNDDYFFEAIDDNDWIRLIRG
jgi:hypothetical protein